MGANGRLKLKKTPRCAAERSWKTWRNEQEAAQPATHRSIHRAAADHIAQKLDGSRRAARQRYESRKRTIPASPLVASYRKKGLAASRLDRSKKEGSFSLQRVVTATKNSQRKRQSARLRVCSRYSPRHWGTGRASGAVRRVSSPHSCSRRQRLSNPQRSLPVQAHGLSCTRVTLAMAR